MLHQRRQRIEAVRWPHVHRLRDGRRLSGLRLSDLASDPQPRLAYSQADARADDRRHVRRRTPRHSRRQWLDATGRP
jgi:hypothetical protein